MKNHQKIAIIGGIILSIVSFFPVIMTILNFGAKELGDPWAPHNPIIYPMIGIGFATLLIIFSFYKK
jgi:hypothetical protein